jgi:hypothetical protein
MKCSIAKSLVSLAVLLIVAGPRAYAQFEVDPDHYETREPDSLQQSKTKTPDQAKIHYEGNFTLPYSLQWNGRSLPPGKYSVSLDTYGRTALVALNRAGQVLRLQGIARSQNRRRQPAALIVTRNGKMHHLSSIRVAQLDLVFDPGPEHLSDTHPRTIENVALIIADPRE